MPYICKQPKVETKNEFPVPARNDKVVNRDHTGDDVTVSL